MNVLSGIYPFGEYTGEILYNGSLCKFNTIKDSENKGIVIIHQELAGSYFNLGWDETFSKADALLKMVGLHESSRTLIKDIGVGKQQLVEIAKALAKNVKLLILDEPTASLNEADSKKLLDLLLAFKKQGMTSILISHKINEVSAISDRITIIRDGAVIKTLDKNVHAFTEDEIISGMVGRSLLNRFPKREHNIAEKTFEVKNWTVYHPLYEGRKVCDNGRRHQRPDGRGANRAGHESFRQELRRGHQRGSIHKRRGRASP